MTAFLETDATEPDLSAILSGPPETVAVALQGLAEQGVAEAQALLGQVYLDGRGVAKDEQVAFDWFREAAKRGHPMAMNMIGRCYENGWGRPADPGTAAMWYSRAADLGLDWAIYNLATLKTLGRGVEVDRAEAFTLFLKAADLGHAKSLNIVGGFYEDGWEVARDLEKAFGFYQRAAEGGDFRGHFNLGRLLLIAGHEAEAHAHFAVARQTATPAFIDKMDAYLSERESAPS